MQRDVRSLEEARRYNIYNSTTHSELMTTYFSNSAIMNENDINNIEEEKPLLQAINYTASKGNTPNGDDDDCAFRSKHGFLMEESKAYSALRRAGLIVSEFRRMNIDDLDLIIANSSKAMNLSARVWSYLSGIGVCTYDATHLEFMVPAGHVQKLNDGDGNYYFAAPGYHNIASMYWTRFGHPVALRGHVQHGDRNILIVDQGFIGYATDNGMPLLLPPGIHEWRSQTMDFVKYIDLEDHLIPIGPYTLLTVDEGYAAVSQDNGKQVILEGGKVHLLNHRNWKFEKFMTLKVQTDELERIQATSADNIIMEVRLRMSSPFVQN